jgi:uncharacterized protein YjbI with pentapeptide repeats
MKIEIKSWLTGSVLFEGDFSSIADALKEALRSGANLCFANLSGAALSRANLSGADLSGANLSEANLSSANLSGANLSGANLSEANLSSANLSRANLSEANLSSANLSGAYLSGAYLSEADWYAYAQVSFNGHGECGRMLTVIRQKEGDEARFLCGCLHGNESELRQYIQDGDMKYVKTRTLALETALKLMAAQNEESAK